jgi:hypothetical protein
VARTLVSAASRLFSTLFRACDAESKPVVGMSASALCGLVERAFKPATSAFMPTFRRSLSACLFVCDHGVRNRPAAIGIIFKYCIVKNSYRKTLSAIGHNNRLIMSFFIGVHRCPSVANYLFLEVFDFWEWEIGFVRN